MGTEKYFTRSIMALILGVADKDMGNGLDFDDGTPNHRALSVACAYGWAMKFGNDAQKKKAREKVETLFHFQDRGHYTWGDTNECLTASHYNWWGTALAALRWFAFEEDDNRVLDLTATWWKQEMALLSLMSVPAGKLAGCIVAPGGRSVYVESTPESGGSVPRDVVYGLFMGLNPKKEKWYANAVEPLSFYQNLNKLKKVTKSEEDEVKPAELAKLTALLATAEPKPKDIPYLDITAPWIVRDLIGKDKDFAKAVRKAAEDSLEDGDRSNMPKLFDRLHVVRTTTGHVAWFDDLTGAKGKQPPQYWALCDYEAGTQKYSQQKPTPPFPPGGFEGKPRIEIF